MKAGELQFVFSLNAKDFMATADKVQAEYAKTKRKFDKPLMFKSGGSADLLAKIAQIGIAVAALRNRFNVFTEFETSMANVASLGVENIEQLTASVLELGSDTPVALNDLSAGLYEVVSAGVDASKQIEVLEASARAGKAGLATTTDALKLASAVVKGYGKGWADTEGVLDQAFQTVKLGQTNFQELAQNMGRVIPIASTLKVTTDELFGAYATLTGVTGNASEVTTQLRGIMSAAAKPTQDLTNLVQSLGYQSASMAMEQEGLAGFLKLVTDATGGNADQMAKLFGQIEAVNGVLALSGPQFETFIEKTDQMKNSTGAMSDAFDKQSQTMEARLQVLQNQFDTLTIGLLQATAPALEVVMGVIGQLLDTWNNLDAGTQKLIIAIGALNVIMFKLPAIIGGVRTAITGLMASMGPGGWLLIGLSTAATLWLTYAGNADKAAEANQKFAKTTNDLNNLYTKLAKNEFENANLEQLIEGRARYQNGLDNLIKRYQALKKAGKDQEQLIRTEKLIQAYQAAVATLDNLIDKREDFNKSTGGGSDELTEEQLQKIDKIREYEFQSNRITLVQYIEYLESRKSALRQSLGEESIEYMQFIDRLSELRDIQINAVVQTTTEDLPEVDLGGNPAEDEIDARVQAEEDAANSIIDIETELNDQRFDVLQSEYDMKRMIINDNLRYLKQTGAQETTAYKKELDKRNKLDKNYFQKKQTLEQQATTTAIQLGAQLLQNIGGDSEAAFNIQKAGAIAQATINAYLGASESLSAYPMPYAAIIAALHVALGLAQVANIAGTEYSAPAYQTGGDLTSGQILQIPGLPVPPGEDGIFAGQIGEKVMNRKAVEEFGGMLDWMNEVGRGNIPQYAQGSPVTTSTTSGTAPSAGPFISRGDLAEFAENIVNGISRSFEDNKPDVHIHSELSNIEWYEAAKDEYDRRERKRTLPTT